jgi:hypothetical protein
MASMSLATVGWGSWWFTALTMKFAPGIAPDPRNTIWFASVFGVFGFLLALWSVRARLAWLLFTIVPLFANGTLLFFPLALDTLEALRERVADERTEEQTEPR